ncbi:putative homoserine kinase [Neospora caninum Liverpool]|uniref:Putative homoserine kinase n=1 Tax=Neospora caninum (strain Liverpool) TaxID=572307 RepID=F0VP92_NEOCL|nr:putative homoserine kinase [Neospora caninum Liverpool]CBZ55538.1 putative homoserine kinase [Neospora caninum Liverpool]|eukprot:XP_003885566.1 putative homoserine kinase [Neospora caninum Liverpool]
MKAPRGDSVRGSEGSPASVGRQQAAQLSAGQLQGLPNGERTAGVPGTEHYEDPVKVWEGVRDATVHAQDLAGRSALVELTDEQNDMLEMRATRDPAERQAGQGAKAASAVLMEQQDIAESPLRIHVRVPATCANLGSGFDCLALAVDIWNDVIVEEAEKQEVVSGFVAVLARLKLTPSKLPKFRFTCHNRIPIARGLGSSCAAIVSGILASTAIAPFLQRRCAGHEMRVRDSKDPEAGERDVALFAMEGEWLHQAGLAVEVCDENFMLKTTCDLEGHADNAAAALFGGLQLALKYTPRDPMTVLATIEKTHYPTPFDIKRAKEAAAAVAAADAVFNSARTALLVYAMNAAAAAAVVAEAGEGGTPAQAADAVEDVLYRLLQDAMDDRLHQTYRTKLNPHLKPMMEAAQRAGALGVCLSGAGPSILAFAMQHHAGEVAVALKTAAAECKKSGIVLIVDPATDGAHTVPFARERDDDGW